MRRSSIHCGARRNCAPCVFGPLLLATAILAGSLFADGARIELNNGVFRAVLPAGVSTAPAEALIVRAGEDESLPPLSGRATAEPGAIAFKPRYPLAPGQRYRAVLSLAGREPLVRVFDVPAPDAGPPATVEAIYPTAAELPENLLRVYFHFSAPMSRGEAYRRIRLVDEQGDRPVEAAFLELEQELWSPDGRRFTLLFDPGRVKRGLVPNLEEGPPLRAGRSYRLEVDAGWLDAQGRPLAASAVKQFRVVAADYRSSRIDAWRIQPPRAGSRDPLDVVFDESLDSALAERVIRVLALPRKAVAGEAALLAGETGWRFIPEGPWKAGAYLIEAAGVLEDHAGNSLGRPFETLPEEGVEVEPPAETLVRKFQIR